MVFILTRLSLRVLNKRHQLRPERIKRNVLRRSHYSIGKCDDGMDYSLLKVCEMCLYSLMKVLRESVYSLLKVLRHLANRREILAYALCEQRKYEI